MKLGKKVRNIAAAFLMVVSTVTPYGGALLRNAYAASGDEPRVTKTISENKDSGGKPDGTYTITLSVTGKASSTNADEGANVVVVLDTSGSMSYYLESDTGRYGSNDTERPASANNSTYHTNVTLYSTRTYNERTRRYECSGEITNNTTSGTVYRNDGNEGCRVYSGQRYDSSKTRLDSAKSSLSSLFSTLLANNTPGHESLVEISFISFSTNATLRNSWTTSGTALNNTLNNSQTIYADGGTNWDDALRLAKSTLDAKNDGDDG